MATHRGGGAAKSLADLAERSMFYGVDLGTPLGVVLNCDRESVAVAEPLPETLPLGVRGDAVAASAVGEHPLLGGAKIALPAIARPPGLDAVHGGFGRVLGQPQADPAGVS